jgi:gamma-glutamylcyclotransferase (GGCT)/AIG2-like uncharacterized protein YtfP
MSAPDPARRELLLFVYDACMSGQPEAAKLAGARSLGSATTEPSFDLVDLGTQISLVPGGTTAVRGEVFAIEAALLATIDVQKGHPTMYKRRRIRLDDGREVEAYTLDPDQTRGRRRIRSGDYRAHVGPATPERHGGAWSQWAKSRGRSPGSR